MQRRIEGLITIIAAGAVLGIGILMGSLLHNFQLSEPSVLDQGGAITCETFGVAAPDAVGRIIIGAVDLCGRSMEWGNVYYPFPADKRNPEPIMPTLRLQ